MNNRLTRRSILHSASALAALGTLSAGQSNAASRAIDFKDPEDNVRAFAKLAGSIKAETVHFFYSGTIFGMTPEESQPLFGYAGIMKYLWRPSNNGGYRYRMFDTGYYADLATGVALNEFENPYTHEVVRPLHPRAGPYDFVAEPGILDWRQSGDDVWTTVTQGIQMPNKLDPAEWPLGSTGETLNFRYEFGFRGKLSELESDDTASAPCLQFFSEISPWYPFLRMGRRPGFNYWSMQGKKINSLSEVPPETRAYLEQDEPEFFDSDEPWIEPANSYDQYRDVMAGRPIWDR